MSVQLRKVDVTLCESFQLVSLSRTAHERKNRLIAAHWAVDGAFALSLFDKFFEFLIAELEGTAQPLEDLTWGEETARLPPALVEAIDKSTLFDAEPDDCTGQDQETEKDPEVLYSVGNRDRGAFLRLYPTLSTATGCYRRLCRLPSDCRKVLGRFPDLAASSNIFSKPRLSAEQKIAVSTPVRRRLPSSIVTAH